MARFQYRSQSVLSTIQRLSRLGWLQTARRGSRHESSKRHRRLRKERRHQTREPTRGEGFEVHKPHLPSLGKLDQKGDHDGASRQITDGSKPLPTIAAIVTEHRVRHFGDGSYDSTAQGRAPRTLPESPRQRKQRRIKSLADTMLEFGRGSHGRASARTLRRWSEPRGARIVVGASFRSPS